MLRTKTKPQAKNGAKPVASKVESDASRWAAIVARDKSCDGEFIYSVATTGVYCRPSCPSRRARRENVAFHATAEDAERAGFRPCKRCKPKQQGLEERNAKLVAAACRAIDDAEEMPTLASLARAAGLSPFHFHRLFKDVTGMTPKAFQIANRHQRVRSHLKGAGTVTEAAMDAGYNSTGRFYATSAKALGMTPSTYRKGGWNEQLRFAIGDCALGAILVAASPKGVSAILLGDDPEGLLKELQDRFPKAELIGGDAAFEKLAARVIAYAENPLKRFELPLDVRGTAFQHRVWQALRDIPSGTTATYSEIAEKIGRRQAVRAVAKACAANPAAIAIPCHRVVRTDGALSGYRWGIERKRTLLAREVGRSDKTVTRATKRLQPE